MKARFIIAMALCLTAVHTGTAGGGLKYDTTEKRVAFAVKNLTMALRSDNAGLVESALRMSAKLKMRHPEADVTALVAAMERIRMTHADGAMRYKAFVAASICTNPEWFRGDAGVTGAPDESFFRTASAAMRDKLLSANTD